MLPRLVHGDVSMLTLCIYLNTSLPPQRIVAWFGFKDKQKTKRSKVVVDVLEKERKIVLIFFSDLELIHTFFYLFFGYRQIVYIIVNIFAYRGISNLH